MKRIIYIIAALAAVVLTSCGPEVDEKMQAMDQFMEAQVTPGIYRASQVEYAFDQNKNQGYFNKAKRIYRIMDESGDKYVQFVLDKDPVVGQTVNVTSKSYGFGLASNITYNNLTVTKMENNLCHLRSDSAGGYLGIIIAWIE